MQLAQLIRLPVKILVRPSTVILFETGKVMTYGKTPVQIWDQRYQEAVTGMFSRLGSTI
jgi:hypothetical protein